MGVPVNEKVIYKKWNEFEFDKSLRMFFGGDVKLERDKMRCLKHSLGHPHFKTSVWRLKVTVNKNTHSVILKIIEKGRLGNEIEINLYRKAAKTLRNVIPEIYSLRVDEDYVWVLMEFCRPIDAQLEFHPKYFAKIIPGLAKMHSRTINKWNNDLYKDWLPFYQSESMRKEREEMKGRTLRYLDKGMKQSEKKANLKSVLKPYYSLLQKIYKKGPIFFPEVIDAGQIGRAHV